MEVRLKLFATLCRHVPETRAGIPFAVEVPRGATLADLVAQLALPAEEVHLTFVNAIAQRLDYVLQPDDEVGIFPAVGGG